MLTGRIGLSPVMVGRGATLARLRGVMDLAELGTTDLPGVALIAGEAGIGKTRLLREMVASLPSDVTVISALAEPSSLGRPFDVARQLTADAGRPVESAIEVIGAAAQRGRVALVVEDLHWIDADSVAVLDAIARQPWPNVVVFATYRPSDLRRGAPGGDLVLRLERRNEVEQFRLDRLDRNEVAAMMSAIAMGSVSSAAVEAVQRRSGGVPFVIEELMRCAGPNACSDDIVGAQLPWSLEEAVRVQLSGLSTLERSVVDALGVYGEPAQFEMLAELAGQDEAPLVEHLRSLMARGVVEETRDDRFWFGHALVADAVPHQLLGRERRRLHERCFEMLQRTAPEHCAALVKHAVGAGRYDAIAAIARQGSRRYLDRGASFQALRLACEGLAEDEHDPDLLAVATEAAWRLDFLPEALEHAEQWQRFARTTAERIDATRILARLLTEPGREEECEAVTESLMSLADELPDGADRARAEAAVAQLQMLRKRDDAVEWADRAIVHAQMAGDRWVEAQAKVERASSLLGRVSRATALAAIREAADEAAALGDGVLLSRALNNTVELLQPNGAQCRALLRQLRRTAADSGFDKLGHMNVLWWEATAAYADGDLATYRRLLNEWSSWTPTPKAQQLRVGDLADLALEEGRISDARRLLDEPSSSSTSSSSSSSSALSSVHTDRVHIADPFTRLALAALDHDRTLGRTAFDAIISRGIAENGWNVLSMALDTVMHALAIGVTPLEIRERVVDEMFATHPSNEQVAAGVEGLLSLAEGKHADAVEALGQLLADADTTLTRPVAGSLYLAYAQALLATDDREGAVRAAHCSAGALARWPGWRRDRADALAARLEGSAARPIGELTARESEVAGLLAEGLTNGQVAERLYISPKTAAVHVSNILAKLSLSNRAEIAAWTVRQDLRASG